MASTRRRNKPNVTSRVGASVNIAVARPKIPKPQSRPAWAVDKMRMVAISVPTERLDVGKRLKTTNANTKVPYTYFPTVRRGSSWVIALVQRTGPGPTDFRVLQKAVGRYNTFNPGKTILQLLADEFGVRLPKKLAQMKAAEISGGLHSKSL